MAVLCLAAIALLSGRPAFSSASRPARGIPNPVVALEVARNVEEVDAVLSDAPSPDREVMRIKQYIDFGFIASYASLYAAMSLLLARDGGRVIAISAAICGVAAALLDVVENLAILRILNVDLRHTTQSMVDSIRLPSLGKWTLASVALLLLAILLLHQKRVSLRLIGVANLAAGAMGVYGIYDNAFLVWAGIPTLAGMFGLALLFFRLR
jgi:hypothetical protein